MFQIQNLYDNNIIQQVANLETILHDKQAWNIDSITELLSSDYIHLIITLDTDNQTVIGYCLYQSLFEQAEILRIGTHPDFHRQGIAQQLLTYLFQHLTNTDSILLEVRADNIPAINLYQKLNFISIDCRKGYYTLVDQSAVDGLIMQKLL